MSNALMAGKRGLIMGLANDKSIAWGIAKACADAGAELAFSYQGDALKKRVDPLAAQLGSDFVVPCDVGSEESMDALFAEIEKRWGTFDFVVHAIGFSDKNELRGRYVDTSRDNFTMTMDISVYSFTAIMQRAEKLMNEGGSAITLTYYGAERIMPHYNVMGVAKAALEASVRYLAEDLGKDGIRAIGAGVAAASLLQTVVVDTFPFRRDTLQELKTLTSVDLSGKGLRGGNDVVFLAELVSAESASLTKLKLNTAELPIDELKTAISVNLSGKGVQPTDCIIIAKLMSLANAPLTDLNISNNEIGDEGAVAIAGALPR